MKTIPIDMQVSISSDEFASEQEAIQALTTLSTADSLRLRQVARLRSAGLSSVEWSDLISEATSRILAGTRRWPRTIPFMAFMIQTIRSVASEEWRRIRHEPVVLEASFADGEIEGASTLAEVASTLISPEREMLAHRTLLEVTSLFEGDDEAMAVLNGLALGSSPSEVQKQSNLSATQYASAQKRIRRMLARRFNLGEMS